MSLAIQQEVDRFFADPKHRKAYEALLTEIEAECKAIQAALAAGIVRAVYSRRDKQSDDPFKSQPKIARALAAKRAENKTAPVSAVEDIIGLTVVVYYPDQIELVRARLLVRLDGRFNVEKDRSLSRGGYHAHHIVVTSDVPDHADLRCEVQIKTMMHDAWAAKMHDLNYKPQGQTDDRLATMMQVLGDALQATEDQSVLLRNLIHERWNAELNRRQAVRRTVFSQLPVIRDRKSFGKEADALYDQILLPEQGPRDWKPLAAKITRLGRTAVREGTWLALRLAAASEQPAHLALAATRVHRFLTEADTLLESGELDGQEVWCLPLALSACGDLEAAISTSRYILDHLGKLAPNDRDMVSFNLANYLVENAVFGPPARESTALRAEIEALLSSCTWLEEAEPSAFHDVRGMIEVAFSTDPIVVRAAIDRIRLGVEDCPPEQRELAEPYAELHMRLAWRRLLELEAQPAAALD